MNQPLINKQSLIRLLSENSRSITKFGVIKLGLFGSFVRNEETEKSDVDFFVEFNPEKKNFDNFIELAFFLQKLTGRRVELVTPQSLSKYFGALILNEVEYVSLAT